MAKKYNNLCLSVADVGVIEGDLLHVHFFFSFSLKYSSFFLFYSLGSFFLTEVDLLTTHWLGFCSVSLVVFPQILFFLPL